VISGLAEVSRKDEQGRQEPGILPRLGGGPEQQGAQAEQQQADDHRGLVAVAAHHRAGRQGQEEIAQIEGHLH
jgi:hypothetical protein